MICPQCGYQNTNGIAVCANCATPLANLCPNCGFENPRGFKFCGNCGTNLLTAALARSNPETVRRLQGFIPDQLAKKILNARAQIEGERRTVTVLFSDVVGFTSISEKLDPETVYSIIDASVAAFREQIYAHEGTLDKFMGDGVMALFGAPIMHEDDPARAVRCALGMQTALKRVNDEIVAPHGITLQMRIGLNLGTVVVADIGSDLKMNYTALGDTVNVASRLQGVAEPGTILASRAVYEQTRALFDFSELGSIRVKGRAEPVEIYQVLGAKREPTSVRGIPGLAAPMVGREKEMARVQHVVETLAREERGGVLLITGEAGMGKSRLTVEMKKRISTLPALACLRVYEGDCVAYGQSAYDVFLQILNELFQIQTEDAPTTRRTKIKTRVAELMPPDRALFEILPYIENLMGLPPIERKVADRIRHLEPAQLRQQTFLAVRDLFIYAARRNPLVLIFEDLHWVDKPSLDLLLFLFNTVQDEPLVLLCISRPADNQAAPQIQRIAGALLNGQFTSVPLEPLSMQDSVALIDLLLTTADLPDTLRQLIPQRAEGNPFFLEEIIRTLIDRNILRRRNDRWEMTPGADVHSVQVPRTLEGLIMTRVDNLPESTRYTAQCAAVIGRDFPDAILRRIADTTPFRLENDLQELIGHELVQQTVVTPERQYAFRHILTQQTIYNSVLLRRREQLHHKIASAIEELYPDRLDEQAERLAFHYGESKDAAKALPHVVRSAEHAAARFANEEALTYYRTALDLATRTQASPEVRTRILVGLGDSQTQIGDFDGAANNLRAAWDLTRTAIASPAQARQSAEIARRLGRVYERRGKYDEAMEWLEIARREINRDVSSGQAVERVRIYLDIGWVHYRRGNLDQAQDWRLRALEISEGLDYYAEMGSAYNGLAALYNLKGDWNRSVEYAQRGLQVREMIGDVEGMSRSHSNIGAIRLSIGEWDEALPHLKRSLELKQRIGDAKQLPLAQNNLGFYYLYKGDLKQAREYFAAARKHAEKIRDPNATCLALNSLAQVDAAEGDFDSAQRLLQSSIQIATDAGVREWLAEALSLLAEVELSRGQITDARKAAERALELGQELGIRQTEAEALRALGAVQRVAGQLREAANALHRSLELSNELQNPFEIARGELELALLYRAQGDFTQARTHLERSRDIFSRLGAANYIQRTQEEMYA
ncbi:MAG TPA: tetratricopeptide repeat protein [Anaerolineae bacterium]|nr:tetratricopeptide repeat protein [Anaerolineae bacterium]